MYLVQILIRISGGDAPASMKTLKRKVQNRSQVVLSPVGCSTMVEIYTTDDVLREAYCGPEIQVNIEFEA